MGVSGQNHFVWVQTSQWTLVDEVIADEDAPTHGSSEIAYSMPNLEAVET